MKVMVTGSNGFIGRQLCSTLASRGFEVLQIARDRAVGDAVAVGNVGPETDWQGVLAAQPDVIIHLAARVHVIKDDAADPLESYRSVNVDGSLNLARQAAAAGVKRFVYLSSIKVNGESSLPDRPFHADDTPAPEDPYGVSKLEAELLLREIACKTSMDVVIIRPPLVYGPGVKANFASMMRWLARGVPLPLAAVSNNRRSMVALDNLVDLIVTCLSHPAAANQTFLVSDGDDLSTADLLKRMGSAFGQPARLFYVPIALLKLVAIVANKPYIYQRLCGSLQLDIVKTRQLLEWTPPLSVDEGLCRSVHVSQ